VQLFERLTSSQNRGSLRALMLMLCGAGSLGVFALLTLSYPLEQDILFPLADIGSLSHYAPEAATLFGLFMALLVAFYLSAYWMLRRAASSSEGLSERAAQIIVMFPILAMLILAHLYPITSLDSINQAIQVRVLTVHHANPLLTPAASFSNDPFTTYDDAQNLPSPYGPVSILLSAGPALLAGNNLLALALLEKMMPILFALGCLRLVWLIASRIAPHRRWQAVFLMGWNPLLLLETAGNGHNDSILLCFVLLACYFLIAGPRWLTLPALALAALVNSLALIFLPLLVVALWRASPPARRAIIVPGSAALALALLSAAVMPFGGVQALGSLLQPYNSYATSLPAILYGFLQPFYSEPAADLIVKALAACLFGIWYLVMLSRLARRSGPQPTSDRNAATTALVVVGYEVAFGFFVLAALAFHPWMILWLLPFAALETSLTLWARTTVFATCGLLAPIILIFISNGAAITGTLDPFTVQLIAVLALFGPVLLVRSLEAIYQRRRLQAALAVKEAELARLQSQLYQAGSSEELTADA
jgi:alpha-1,6-mannosyltransferase